MSWWVVPEGTVGAIIGDLGQIAEGTFAQGSIVHVVQASTAPAHKVAGPYTTQAAAQAEANSINSGVTRSTTGSKAPVNQAAPSLRDWSLVGSGIAGWFVRGLKMLFGGILIVIGISHLTGMSNQLTDVAKKAAPYLAV